MMHSKTSYVIIKSQRSSRICGFFRVPEKHRIYILQIRVNTKKWLNNVNRENIATH